MTTIIHKHYGTPAHLHKPRHNPQSTKTKIAIAQTQSVKARKAPITLPVPDWAKDETKEKVKK